MKSDEKEKRERVLGRIRRRIDDSGVKLTERQIEFLEEATWQARQKSKGHRPGTMTNGQRKAKHDLLGHLRQGLLDLTISDEGGLGWGEAWWKKSDLKKALDKKALLEVIRIAVRHFGREYADPILAELGDAYRIGSEEIVIQRRVSRFP